MIKKLLMAGLVLILLSAFIVTPVSAQSAQPIQQHKQVNTIYVWTNGSMSWQQQLTVWALSKQYKVVVLPYAGNNAARFMYGVMSAPAITVMYSTGDVHNPIDAFNLYGSQMNYFYIQYRIYTN